MITPEQLAEIKDRQFDRRRGKDSPILNDVDTLILACEKLQAALTAKDRVLSQFADSENWREAEWDCNYCWCSGVDSDPKELAKSALTGNR